MMAHSRPDGWLCRALENPWGNWLHWCTRCGPSFAIIGHTRDGERAQ